MCVYVYLYIYIYKCGVRRWLYVTRNTYMWFCFYWTNLSLTTLSLLLYQRRHKRMQFRSYATFSLLKTSPFWSDGDPQGRHGQTTDNWHKSTFTDRRPPSQGLHKFKTQDGKTCFITTISSHYFWTISTQRSYRREKKGVVVFRALTTSQGRSHFDLIGKSEANLRRVFTLDVLACPRADCTLLDAVPVPQLKHDAETTCTGDRPQLLLQWSRMLSTFRDSSEVNFTPESLKTPVFGCRRCWMVLDNGLCVLKCKAWIFRTVQWQFYLKKKQDQLILMFSWPCISATNLMHKFFFYNKFIICLYILTFCWSCISV